MDELIARVSKAAGIEPELAQQAVGEIFAFLKREVPPEPVQKLLGGIAGANELADSIIKLQPPAVGGGLLSSFGSLMGGGVMGLASKLMGLGLNTGEMQSIGQELFRYTHEKVGKPVVDDVVAFVPSFRQFS